MASTNRRRRMSVDLPADTEAATREIAERYFRGVATDALRAALSLMSWTVDARRSGKRVIAVDADELPNRFEEPVLAGLEEQLGAQPIWLVERPHPWRRQLWIKGRRLAAGDVARTIEINGWSPEEAADQLQLPLPAVLEAQHYLVENRDLVLAEEAENARAARDARTVAREHVAVSA